MGMRAPLIVLMWSLPPINGTPAGKRRQGSQSKLLELLFDSKRLIRL